MERFAQWAELHGWYLVNTKDFTEWGGSRGSCIENFYFTPSGNAYHVAFRGDEIIEIQSVKIEGVSIDYQNYYHIGEERNVKG